MADIDNDFVNCFLIYCSIQVKNSQDLNSIIVKKTLTRSRSLDDLLPLSVFRR